MENDLVHLSLKSPQHDLQSIFKDVQLCGTFADVTLVSDDRKTNNAHEDLSCFSCKNNYNDRTCVVEHVVEHMRVYLCLNCDGWIQEKQNIMNPGWSLYDNFGQLRRDI